jgi:hypothetical protein
MPGTATATQIGSFERLLGQELGFHPSSDQAHLALAAWDYAKAATKAAIKVGHRPTEYHRVCMIAKIINQQNIRSFVSGWAEDRYRRGTDNSEPRITRTSSFVELWERLAITGKNREARQTR